MTSNRVRKPSDDIASGKIGECYVYVQLPGATEFVTCGRFERTRTRQGNVFGRFVYGQSYLSRADAMALDPTHLPLKRGAQDTAVLSGIFGALRDASPDAWGRRIIERKLQRSPLDEIDYLLNAPEDHPGALSFGLGPNPPAPAREFNRILKLPELREAARLIEETSTSDTLPEQVQNLLDPGASLGGARPKNVVEDSEGLWVAKFPQKGDRWNNAVVEGAMLKLAQRCGIRIPKLRIEKLGSESVLLVQRFDRQRVEPGTPQTSNQYFRFGLLSALTVLGAEESPTSRDNWSYLRLADELQRISEDPAEDKRELFRRMVFNALISNSDDHPRNHALMARSRAWRLAPAYDLTPSPSHSIELRELALVCGLQGRAARRKNLVSDAAGFGFSPENADSMISEMKKQIAAEWESEVKRLGGTEPDCMAIRNAFVYEGFEY